MGPLAGNCHNRAGGVRVSLPTASQGAPRPHPRRRPHSRPARAGSDSRPRLSAPVPTRSRLRGTASRQTMSARKAGATSSSPLHPWPSDASGGPPSLWRQQSTCEGQRALAPEQKQSWMGGGGEGGAGRKVDEGKE